MDASADGRRIVVACAEAGSGPAVDATPQLRFDFELLVIDATTGERRTVKSHGRDFGAVAVSPAGEAIATGDSGGSIRVGSVDGGEPHFARRRQRGGYVSRLLTRRAMACVGLRQRHPPLADARSLKTTAAHAAS